MYRRRNPQRSLFSSSLLVPEVKAARLRNSWAEAFRTRALPLIDEDSLAFLYADGVGRPNRAIQTVLGVLLLKELFDLTDQETLGALEFDLRWQHALDLTPEEAHLPQKTLHNFRQRLLSHEAGRMIFEQTTDRILEALGTDVSRQRVDSTHIVSNMARLTRLGLFCETVRVFLRQVHKLDEGLYEQVPIGLRRRYVRDDGTDSGYADARSEQGRRRLKVCARDVYRLHRRFAGTAAAQLEGYGLLARLLEQQCTVVSSDQGPGDDEDDGGEGPVPVLLKDPSQINSDTLQSPHDPDATYSGHKGKGYEVQVCETCSASNEVEVITHVEVTEACASDQQATLPVLDAVTERGHQPEELLAAIRAVASGDAIVAPTAIPIISPTSGCDMPYMRPRKTNVSSVARWKASPEMNPRTAVRWYCWSEPSTPLKSSSPVLRRMMPLPWVWRATTRRARLAMSW